MAEEGTYDGGIRLNKRGKKEAGEVEKDFESTQVERLVR